MAEADTLRLVAEVVDKFSAPMRNLRTQLQGMGKEGASHTDAVVKGFQKVEGAAKGASQVVTTTLNPALAAVGVTGLGVAAALTGIGASLRALGGSLASLGMLSRETGVSAENLRVIQGVMGKFGIESEAASGAVKNFAQSMRLARDGIGPIMEFLRTQGRSAEGRKFFNDLADDLQRSKDNGEALTKALEALENIKDPSGRMEYAQRLFGNADIGRLGDQHLGRLREVIEQQRKLLGPLDEGAVRAAENFEKAMSSMRSTMQRLGTAIATEALPYVSDFVKGLEGLVKGGREDVTGPLRESIRTVGEALREIDWKQASKDVGVFVKDAGDGLKGILAVAKELAAIMRSLREGNIADATRRADGASGPLARRLAPQVGDDEIDSQEKVEKLQKLLQASREAQQHVIGRAQIGAGLLDDPDKLARELAAEEERLQALRSRSPEQRQGDFARQRGAASDDARTAPLRDRMAKVQGQLDNYDAMVRSGTANEAGAKRAEDLRREMSRLTEELKRLRDAMPDKQPGQATAQQSSVEGEGPFPGAKILTASYGGGSYGGLGAVGGMLRNRGGGIYVPPRGGRGPASGFDRHGEDLPGAPGAQGGPRGNDGAPRSPSTGRQPLERRGFSGGGRFNGLGPGMVPQPVPGGPGERVGRSLRGEGDGRTNARQSEGAGVYRPQYPLSDADLDQRVVNTIAGEVSTKNAEGVDAVINNMLNRVGSKGWGPSKNLLEVARAPGQYAGYRRAAEAESEFVRSRIRAIASGGVPDNTGGSNSYRAESYYRQTQGRGRGYWAGRAEIGPNVGGNRYAFEPGFRNGPYAPYTDGGRPQATERADGEGFAARQRAMRKFGAEEKAEANGRAFAEDYRARVAEAQKQDQLLKDSGDRAMSRLKQERDAANVSGSVVVNVMKPGPDTKVNTSASGNLFRDVAMRRGEAMKSSEGI